MDGHTACMGDMRNAYKRLIRKHESKGHSQDLRVYRKMIILECT